MVIYCKYTVWANQVLFYDRKVVIKYLVWFTCISVNLGSMKMSTILLFRSCVLKYFFWYFSFIMLQYIREMYTNYTTLNVITKVLRQVKEWLKVKVWRPVSVWQVYNHQVRTTPLQQHLNNLWTEWNTSSHKHMIWGKVEILCNYKYIEVPLLRLCTRPIEFGQIKWFEELYTVNIHFGWKTNGLSSLNDPNYGLQDVLVH